MNDFKGNNNIEEALKDKVLRQTLDLTERKGFNLTNVRIDGLKRKKAKPMPWDISNFSATYAYSEINRRNINIEFSANKSYKGNLLYTYNIRNPLTLKPFTKIKALDNKWFTLIKEFNLQLLPNSFGASIDFNRTFNDLKNRDITSIYANSNVFENPILINKNFTLSRSYNLRWDFCKAIKLTYNASNEGRVLEPQGYVTKRQAQEYDTLMRNLRNLGTNTVYRQQYNLDVNVPLNKIPLFDFTTLTYRFSGTYTWNRRPFAAADSIGNTIQNTGGHNYTANFNMTQLYNKIPYFKRVNNGTYKNKENEKVKLKIQKQIQIKVQQVNQQKVKLIVLKKEIILKT
jgi:cell surface protein SprA